MIIDGAMGDIRVKSIRVLPILSVAHMYKIMSSKCEWICNRFFQLIKARAQWHQSNITKKVNLNKDGLTGYSNQWDIKYFEFTPDQATLHLQEKLQQKFS